MYLLQDRQQDGAADAAEYGADQETVDPVEMERQAADFGDGRHRKNKAEDREKKAGREMLQDFTELQVQAAFEKYEDQRQGAKALRGAAKNIGVDPMQHG